MILMIIDAHQDNVLCISSRETACHMLHVHGDKGGLRIALGKHIDDDIYSLQ